MTSSTFLEYYHDGNLYKIGCNISRVPDDQEPDEVFFVNQNDLATYLAFCWPFMLCAFFFTRRFLWLVLDALLMAAGAAAFTSPAFMGAKVVAPRAASKGE